MKNKSVNNIIIGAIAGIGIVAGSVAFAQGTIHKGTGGMGQMGNMGQMHSQTAAAEMPGQMTNGGMNMQMAQATMQTMRAKFINGEMPDQATINEFREKMQSSMGTMNHNGATMDHGAATHHGNTAAGK